MPVSVCTIYLIFCRKLLTISFSYETVGGATPLRSTNWRTPVFNFNNERKGRERERGRFFEIVSGKKLGWDRDLVFVS